MKEWLKVKVEGVKAIATSGSMKDDTPCVKTERKRQIETNGEGLACLQEPSAFDRTLIMMIKK